MNWAGLLFGFCAALALVAAAYTVFARETPHAIGAAAAAMLGVAGMCLALGSDFVAVAVGLVLGVAVPAAALVATHVAPPPSPDVREGRGRLIAVAVIVVSLFAALGWLVTQTGWPPAGGVRDLTAPWLGWRLLTEDLLALVVLMALLSVAGIAAASLLRARQPRPGRPNRGGPR